MPGCFRNGGSGSNSVSVQAAAALCCKRRFWIVCFFNVLSHSQDPCGLPVIDVGGGQVAQALVVAMVAIVLDEGLDLTFQVSRQEIGALCSSP